VTVVTGATNCTSGRRCRTSGRAASCPAARPSRRPVYAGSRRRGWSAPPTSSGCPRTRVDLHPGRNGRERHRSKGAVLRHRARLYITPNRPDTMSSKGSRARSTPSPAPNSVGSTRTRRVARPRPRRRSRSRSRTPICVGASRRVHRQRQDRAVAALAPAAAPPGRRPPDLERRGRHQLHHAGARQPQHAFDADALGRWCRRGGPGPARS